MMDEWEEFPFSEAVLVNPPSGLKVEQPFPFVDMQAIDIGTRDVSASEIREFKGNGSKFQARDTLMARITPCLENGKIARYLPDTEENRGHGSTEFIVIRGRPGVTDNDYAYYLTVSQEVRSFAISQMTGSSGRQRVPTEALKNIFVLVPPLHEQRVIAHILGKLDDKIENNRRMNETLEAMARAVFNKWLVEPAEGGLPKGWREVPLPEAIEVNPSRPLRKSEVAPYLDMSKMPTRSARAMEVFDRAFGSGMRFKSGDTLVARITPCLENGKTCFVDFLSDNKIGWGSTEYIVFRPKPPLPPEFAYFMARTDDFRAFAISNMTGTSGRQRVPANCFDNFTVIVPPTEIAERFGRYAKFVLEKIKSNDMESRSLGAIRDALLPKLLNGEIQAPNTKRVLTSSSS